MTTKIKKSIGHDRMTLKVIFDNGDDFKFNISRSRDSYGAGQLAKTEPITQAEFNTIVAWCKLRSGENHLQRYERFEKVAMKACSLEALAMLIELEPPHAA
jgi:hypothetical protein